MAKKTTKKRGVRPGIKRKYTTEKQIKNRLSNLDIIENALKSVSPWKVSENQVGESYIPKQSSSLCGQLEDAIQNLENRISNSIAKINSLM